MTISDEDLRAAIALTQSHPRGADADRRARGRPAGDPEGERPPGAGPGRDDHGPEPGGDPPGGGRRISSNGRRAAEAGPERKRIILSGGVCNQPDIYTIIEEAGGAVVGDDLCTGSRSFSGLIDETARSRRGDRRSDTWSGSSVRRSTGGSTERADHLVRLVREKRAQGVIFFLLKFCDPHAFDYPYLKEALDKAGIPSMLIEVEDRLPADGQLRTRFEAFIEMI